MIELKLSRYSTKDKEILLRTLNYGLTDLYSRCGVVCENCQNSKVCIDIESAIKFLNESVNRKAK